MTRSRQVTISIIVLSVGLGVAPAEQEPSTVSLFDGKTLNGWRAGDPGYWSVEDGAITARITAEHPCTTNQYLVWDGGDVADFELELESRISGDGAINNGFQFRSRLMPDGDVCGYQVDNNLDTQWLVRLYDEYGRHDLALRGECAIFNDHGERSVSPLADAGGDAWFTLEEWHRYRLVCVDNLISLYVDGKLAAQVEDNDNRRADRQGILALQLHSGPPTVAQFRNIRLTVIKPAEKPAPPAAAHPVFFKEAFAHWPLELAGHGLLPTLRAEPQFYQLQLNVRAAGERARPNAMCLILEGAYLTAGRELGATGDAVTVYLRARDPKGAWNSALFSKRGGHDRVQFNLFSADTDGDGGGDIGFEVRTERQFAMVSFPAATVSVTAWHDVVGRYDGSAIAVFCDGVMMASAPCTGVLMQNDEPVLIGAETDAGNIVRHFHGELEEAALWDRALTDAEIAAISAR